MGGAHVAAGWKRAAQVRVGLDLKAGVYRTMLGHTISVLEFHCYDNGVYPLPNRHANAWPDLRSVLEHVATEIHIRRSWEWTLRSPPEWSA